MTDETPKETTLLVDGDTIAFVAAAASQEPIMDFDGFIKPMANAVKGETIVDNMLLGLTRDLEAHFLRVFLSDPEGNWRAGLMPDYKGNRVGKDRPMLLGHLKNYLRKKYGAVHYATLEADDVLGILATTPGLHEGCRNVVVGKDKDFRTIPGLHHQLDKDITSSGKRFVREVTQEEADWFHLVQTLAGDRIDGYPGCPGIGMERAKQILADPKILTPEHGVVTRGDRKGPPRKLEPNVADMVNLPPHYARFKIEPIRYAVENQLNTFQFNINKYCARAPHKHKDGGLEDIRKVIRYAVMYYRWIRGDKDWWKAYTDEFQAALEKELNGNA